MAEANTLGPKKETSRSRREKARFRVMLLNSLGLVVSGLGVGWLMGISASPVVQVVVGALITAVIGVGAILGQDRVRVGRESEAQSEHKAGLDTALAGLAGHLGPAASGLLIIGVLLGSSAGIIARTRNLLAPDPDTVIAAWTKRGLKPEEIAKQLFDQMYPSAPLSSGKDVPVPPRPQGQGGLTMLFSLSTSECDNYTTRPDQDLQKEMASSLSAELRSFAQRHTDAPSLRAVVNLLCGK